MNMQATDCPETVVPVYHTIVRYVPEDGNIKVQAKSALIPRSIIVRVLKLREHFTGCGLCCDISCQVHLRKNICFHLFASDRPVKLLRLL
jgi:hypothetical protein